MRLNVVNVCRLVAAAVLLVLAGCSSVTSSLTGRLAASLNSAVVNQNDPETVRQGAPAYLLMVDGFINDDPENPDVLLIGARLYSSYTGAFVDDPERARVLSAKAKAYGLRGLCVTNKSTCGAWELPYEDFAEVVGSLTARDVDAAYVAAAAWGTWVQANRDDWVAVADKARVELMMQRVVELDEGYENGNAHLYLGVLATLLPEALGGKPEQGRQHFEKAIEISGDRALMAKVLLARDYARLVFDRELHDQLCREVIDADPVVEGMTLANTVAQQEAESLLADSLDYFGE